VDHLTFEGEGGGGDLKKKTLQALTFTKNKKQGKKIVSACTQSPALPLKS